MEKIQSKLQTDIQGNLTCSLCLNLFAKPKMMPECLHTFCLDCLNSVKVERKTENVKESCSECHATVSKALTKSVISCPECRAETMLSDGESVENFKTNLVVQNIVDAVRHEHEKSGIGSSACNHTLLYGKQKQKCKHCDQWFCTPCRVYHMETLKMTVVQKGNQTIDKCLGLPVKKSEFHSQLKIQTDAVVEKAKRIADDARARFEAILAKKVAAIEENMKRFTGEVGETLDELADDLSDPEKLGAFVNNHVAVTSLSVLEQDLIDVAECHSEVEKRSNELAALDDFLDPQKPMDFTENPEMENLLTSFQSISLGSFNSGSSDAVPNVEITAELPEDVAAFEEVENKTEDESGWLKEFVELDVKLMTNEIRVHLPQPAEHLVDFDETTGILVVFGGNNLRHIDTNGNFVKEYNICCPDDASSLMITDCVVSLGIYYFIAKVYCTSGKISHRIYRFLASSPRLAHPIFYAEAADGPFAGLATFYTNGLLVFDGETLVWFKAEDAVQPARKLWSHHLGKNPRYHFCWVNRSIICYAYSVDEIEGAEETRVPVEEKKLEGSEEASEEEEEEREGSFKRIYIEWETDGDWKIVPKPGNYNNTAFPTKFFPDVLPEIICRYPRAIVRKGHIIEVFDDITRWNASSMGYFASPLLKKKLACCKDFHIMHFWRTGCYLAMIDDGSVIISKMM